LTPREREILDRVLLAQKQTAIAAELGLHPNTVFFHLANVRRKLRVGSVIELVILACRSPQLCSAEKTCQRAKRQP
jgi:DNA-binding CsgD family transcriptional regulator